MRTFICCTCKYEHSNDFENARCRFCDEQNCASCVDDVTCFNCENVTCGSCGNLCDDCGEFFCSDCLTGDNTCPLDECPSNQE